MRFVIQRALDASCVVDGVTVGSIDRGYVVLIGVSRTDTEAEADRLVKKMLGLRIFEDEAGKTNLSLRAVGGSLLLISQFTLYADTSHGNRPSFIYAGEPERAMVLYEYIVAKCRAELDAWNADESGELASRDARHLVAEGVFGAEMRVSFTNDGPFTILLDSDAV